MSESEVEKEQPFEFDKNGQVHCKWPGCTSVFPGDVPGMKAWANHYHAHVKRGSKVEEGVSPETLAALAGLREKYDEARKRAIFRTCEQIKAERDQIFEVYIPIPIDALVKYGRIRVHEFNEIKDLPEEDYIRKLTYLMWSKGDSTVTWESIRDDFTVDELEIILSCFLENTPFFYLASSPSDSSKNRKSNVSS